MSSNKYRVEQNGVFLGHHSSNTTDKIIDKAINKYGRFYSINVNEPFVLTRGQKTLVYTIGQEKN